MDFFNLFWKIFNNFIFKNSINCKLILNLSLGLLIKYVNLIIFYSNIYFHFIIKFSIKNSTDFIFS